MDLRRLRAGEWIAALGGALLLISLFLTWYESGAAAGSVTGWQALTVADVLLALVAAAAIALVFVTATQRVPAIPLAMASLLALAGMVALVIVLIRMASPPGSAEDLGAGIWLALAGAVVTIAGGWIAMRDERLSTPGRITDLAGSPDPASPPIETLPAP